MTTYCQYKQQPCSRLEDAQRRIEEFEAENQRLHERESKAKCSRCGSMLFETDEDFELIINIIGWVLMIAVIIGVLVWID